MPIYFSWQIGYETCNISSCSKKHWMLFKSVAIMLLKKCFFKTIGIWNALLLMIKRESTLTTPKQHNNQANGFVNLKGLAVQIHCSQKLRDISKWIWSDKKRSIWFFFFFIKQGFSFFLSGLLFLSLEISLNFCEQYIYMHTWPYYTMYFGTRQNMMCYYATIRVSISPNNNQTSDKALKNYI